MSEFQDRPPEPGDPREFSKLNRFQLEGFVELATNRLVSPEGVATGIVLGLTGPWGGGKTFVLNWIESQLKKKDLRKTIVLRFDPWRVSGRSDLLLYFLQRLSEAIATSNADGDWTSVFPETFQKLRAVLRPYKETVQDVAEVAADLQLEGAGKLIATVLGQTTEQLFKSVTDKLSSNGLHVICLIDDLDRLEDAEIRSVAMLVKSVGNIETASYLLAYDPSRVASALSRDGTTSDGLRYLEKIVQLQLRLPIIHADDLRKFAFDLLGITKGKDWQDTSFADLQRVMHDLIPRILWVPRDIIRFSHLVDARIMSASNIRKTDVLRFCALETRFPLLPERMSGMLYRCTIDGIRELKRRPEVSIEVGDAVIEHLLLPDRQSNEGMEQFQEEKSLLIELFPALSEAAPDRVARPINRLCYESSLRTLLNYQESGSLLKPEEADGVLKGRVDLSDTLTEASVRNVVRHAHLQLRTRYSQCELDDDARNKFWRALGGHLDHCPTMDSAQNWSVFLDLSHVWVRGIATEFLDDEGMNEDFIVQLLEDLLAEGRVHLPACMLYFSASAAGGRGLKREREYSVLLPVHQVERLLEKAACVIGSRILDGEEFCIKSLYPIWVAKSDETAGKVVREALSHPRKPAEVDRVVALVYRTWRDEVVEGLRIREFIDRDALLAIVKKKMVASAEKPFLMQKAYRFVRECLSQ